MLPAGIPDPTALYRVRDGVYAGDLLVAAVAELDLAAQAGFTAVEHRPTAGDRSVLLARKPG